MDSDDLSGPRASIGRECANCGARLATDQRYCLNCGTRRGALPARVQSMLHEMLSAPSAPVVEPVPVVPAPAPRAPFGLQMPTPRVASLLVMAMLSFGVIAGSLTGPGGVEALAHSLVVSLPPSVSAPVATNAGGGDGGGGGVGGGGNTASGGSPQQAITETITEPAPSSGGGGATAPVSPPPVSTTTDTGTGTSPNSGSAAVSLPPIKHVFLVMLSGQGYTQSFAITQGHPYLSGTLRKQGELITNYYGVASSSLASEIGLLSGQGPTLQTAANCPTFTNIAPTGHGSSAQVIGNGCVYPPSTGSLPSELTDNGNSWRAYIQGIDQGPAGTQKSCRYAAPGTADPNQIATATDPYVTYLNPFVYFASLTSGTQCALDDVGLDGLAQDLKQVKTTANLTYIAPDACNDGSDTPCMAGAPAGLAPADAFLKTVVPEIEASPAYKQDGMIVITFDQAPQTGTSADSTSCCDQPSFPNLAGTTGTTTTGTTTTGTTSATTVAAGTSGTDTTGATTTPTDTTGATTTPTDTTTSTTVSTSTSTSPSTSGTTSCPTTGTTTGTTSTTTTTTVTSAAGCPPPGTPPGGGQVGALVISRYVKAGTEDGSDTFNHFSLLKTIENLFSIPTLGYSKDASLPEFDTAVFSNYTAG